MNDDDFYKEMMEPHAPDSMVIALEVTNPDNPYSFSKEAIDGVMDKFERFVLARILGNWKGMGQPPKKMRMSISLDFTQSVNAESETMPWFLGETDDIGFTQLDGELRKFPIDK